MAAVMTCGLTSSSHTWQYSAITAASVLLASLQAMAKNAYIDPL